MLRRIKPVLLVLLISCDPPAEKYVGGHSDPDKPIEVKSGETFVIELPSNPSTGYSWSFDLDPKSEILHSIESRTIGSPEPKPGMGGTMVWKFHAAKPGTVKVTFSSKRGNDTGDSKTFSITVK